MTLRVVGVCVAKNQSNPFGYEDAATVWAYVCGLLAVDAHEEDAADRYNRRHDDERPQLPVAIHHAMVVILAIPIGMLMAISVLVERPQLAFSHTYLLHGIFHVGYGFGWQVAGSVERVDHGAMRLRASVRSSSSFARRLSCSSKMSRSTTRGGVTS